jgi:hypothetical protein
MHLRPFHVGTDHRRGAAGDLAHQAEAVAARGGDVERAHRPAAADTHRDRHSITRVGRLCRAAWQRVALAFGTALVVSCREKSANRAEVRTGVEERAHAGYETLYPAHPAELP